MTRPGLVAALLGAVLVSAACTRMSDGVALTDGERQKSAPSWGTSQPSTTQTAQPDPRADNVEPGVMPTAQTAAPAGAVCVPEVLSPVRTVAQVSDPLAPTATVVVPQGWSVSATGDDPAGARMQGPGMDAIVTIARTSLDPAAAFREYVDNLTSGFSISTVSTLPGQMCGYSGQRLIGILSDGEETVQYEDRVVHVPTAAADYLIVVHVEAPADTPGFDEPASQLTEDFEIGLP